MVILSIWISSMIYKESTLLTFWVLGIDTWTLWVSQQLMYKFSVTWKEKNVKTNVKNCACLSFHIGVKHCSWCNGSSDRSFMVDTLSYFSFEPVLHDWFNKGHGMCYPVCGMLHIKESLLLIGKSSPCCGSRFPLSLSYWSFTICLMPYNRK